MTPTSPPPSTTHARRYAIAALMAGHILLPDISAGRSWTTRDQLHIAYLFGHRVIYKDGLEGRRRRGRMNHQNHQASSTTSCYAPAQRHTIQYSVPDSPTPLSLRNSEMAPTVQWRPECAPNNKPAADAIVAACQQAASSPEFRDFEFMEIWLDPISFPD